MRGGVLDEAREAHELPAFCDLRQRIFELAGVEEHHLAHQLAGVGAWLEPKADTSAPPSSRGESALKNRSAAPLFDSCAESPPKSVRRTAHSSMERRRLRGFLHSLAFIERGFAWHTSC